MEYPREPYFTQDDAISDFHRNFGFTFFFQVIPSGPYGIWWFPLVFWRLLKRNCSMVPSSLLQLPAAGALAWRFMHVSALGFIFVWRNSHYCLSFCRKPVVLRALTLYFGPELWNEWDNNMKIKWNKYEDMDPKFPPFPEFWICWKLDFCDFLTEKARAETSRTAIQKSLQHLSYETDSQPTTVTGFLSILT